MRDAFLRGFFLKKYFLEEILFEEFFFFANENRCMSVSSIFIQMKEKTRCKANKRRKKHLMGLIYFIQIIIYMQCLLELIQIPISTVIEANRILFRFASKSCYHLV